PGRRSAPRRPGPGPGRPRLPPPPRRPPRPLAHRRRRPPAPLHPPAAPAPGGSAVATFDWEVPGDLPRALCFLALATAAGSPAPGAGDPADLVTRDPRWGCKNPPLLSPEARRVVRLEPLGGVGGGRVTLA